MNVNISTINNFSDYSIFKAKWQTDFSIAVYPSISFNSKSLHILFSTKKNRIKKIIIENQ